MPGETDAEREPLFTPRRARRMTRTHAVLWSVILAATAADIVLTVTGLANGLREGNVVLHALVSEFGLAGLWGLKFAAMVWLVAGWALLSDRNAAIFLALFALVTVAVVVNNAVLVAGL
ncbi:MULTISPECIES: DUF5658 family protein [Salinibaculum]|uniref:DUF5658 family protein n=1 Tax=Salinibaculum TaxID=2732368 RepID=UPI0030D03573